jgi:hypothetical protein
MKLHRLGKATKERPWLLFKVGTGFNGFEFTTKYCVTVVKLGDLVKPLKWLGIEYARYAALDHKAIYLHHNHCSWLAFLIRVECQVNLHTSL